MTRYIPALAVFGCPSCGAELTVPGRLHEFAVHFDEDTMRFVALEHALGDPSAHEDLFAVLDAEG